MPTPAADHLHPPAPDLPLSVALACRNNEATIGRLLDSLALLGGGVEVVALDNGSTDATIDILERHGARVIRGQWRGHIGTKQDAMDACTRPWVLNLDSDESLQPGLAAAIADVVRRDDPDVAACRINRQTWYRNRPLRFAWQPDRVVRLVRRDRAVFAGVEPHPQLVLRPGARGRIIDLAGDRDGGHLRHDSFETFAEHLARQARYSHENARALAAAGKRGSYLRLMTSPPGAFLKQLILKQGLRDGYRGWLAAATTAAGALMKHAILIELTREQERR